MLIEGSIFKFPTDTINIFSLNFDESNSMEEHIEKVKKGFRIYKRKLENFPESNTLGVAISKFSCFYTPGAFKGIEEFDESYSPSGTTALYTSIKQASENLLDYIEKIISENEVIPQATLMFLSDGESCGEAYDDDSLIQLEMEAKEAIARLNEAKVNTIFVAFGDAIKSEFGARLGFTATKDVEREEELVDFMEEFSECCKEQSQRSEPLGSEFFSKATNSKSSGYTAKASQALDDADWFDDVLI